MVLGSRITVFKQLMSWCAAALLLAGCAASGHNFNASKLSTLTPGQSTMEDTVRALGALPDQIYAHPYGGSVAMWRFMITFVPEGFYSRKEVRLQFGPDGRLVRMLDSTNILLEPWEREKLLGPAPAAPVLAPAVEAVPAVELIVIPGPGEGKAQ
ncbi:hypothetical protein [Bordetella avium]|uniref:Lipoprotein n=1 Tax=Bordetella avium (strain 197N) TaxID=360910 RepID=Q2L1A3_BORA1|nr:hypothetical protein C0J07_07905 [Bordetella avium]CAJ49309.1 putative lipoprotein [Bordetella avium 197N]RIQ11534.1 hypothetical protein D0432_16525 [Bordetella avium]RIQ15875.1 hypothetical protein D0850_16960 [Bordetella avium]RIQ30067.1 hypothetical protein D0849_16515 [Bordetella avium]